MSCRIHSSFREHELARAYLPAGVAYMGLTKEVDAFIPFTDAVGNKYALWIEDKSSHTSLNDIGRKLYQQFNGLYKEKGEQHIPTSMVIEDFSELCGITIIPVSLGVGINMPGFKGSFYVGDYDLSLFKQVDQNYYFSYIYSIIFNPA